MATAAQRRHSQAPKRRFPWYYGLSKPVKMSRVTMIGLIMGAMSVSRMFSVHPSRHYISVVKRDKQHRREPFVFASVPITISLEVESWEVKRQERRKRTQPPQSYNGNVIQYELLLQPTNQTVEPDWKIFEGYHHAICGRHAKAAADKIPHHYHQELLLDSKARVVITNILSSTGMHLALKLSKECGVNAILGIDALLPNTRRNRVDLIERYAMLKRRIPELQKIISSYSGVLPRLDVERLYSFRATHIVHLVPDFLHGEDNQLYPLRDKMQSMEQLLDLIRHNEVKPHLLYAGPDLKYEHILAAHYHAHYNIHSIGLEMPHLYGPWEQAGSWAWNAAEGIIKRRNTPHTPADVLADNALFLYVEDAVDAIVAASQYDNGLVILGVTSHTTKKSLKKVLTNIANMTQQQQLDPELHWQNQIHWMPETQPLAGIQRLLSWHFSSTHPYGRGDYQRKLPSFIKENFHYQFPCASECSIPGSCIPTIYDEVARTSRKLTKGCKYVVYMVDLSRNATTLPRAVDIPPNYTSYMCHIAFVSQSSIVARKKDKHRGWSLLRVAKDDSKMTEAEFMLPKLSPSLFFDKTVAKAIFVNPETFALLDGPGLIAFSRSIDASSRGGKHVPIRRPGTHIIRWDWDRGQAARLVMLFGHEDPLVNTHESFASRVKVIADRDGARSSSRQMNQVQFYEHAAHLVQSTESRRLDELRPPSYKNFPFHFLRSNMVVHDLRVDQARLLRCEWYDEQVFWGVRHLEDVSMAFVLAKRRVRGQHGPDEGGWTPLVLPVEDEMEVGDRVTSFGGAELFMRVLPRPLSALEAENEAMNEAIEDEVVESPEWT